jgi:hypothetical protein
MPVCFNSAIQNKMVYIYQLLRVRAKINSQILSIEALGWQGAKAQGYRA